MNALLPDEAVTPTLQSMVLHPTPQQSPPAHLQSVTISVELHFPLRATTLFQVKLFIGATALSILSKTPFQLHHFNVLLQFSPTLASSPPLQLILQEETPPNPSSVSLCLCSSRSSLKVALPSIQPEGTCILLLQLHHETSITLLSQKSIFLHPS